MTTGYDIDIAKLQVSRAILHCVSNEPEVYLEPNQTSMWQHFCKIFNGYKPLTVSAKKASS